MQACIITLFAHQCENIWSLWHVTVLTANSLGSIRALFPLELGALNPDAVRILFIVAVTAELCGPVKIALHDLVCRRLNLRLTPAVLGHARDNIIAEIKRRIGLSFLCKVTHFARNRSVSYAISVSYTHLRAHETDSYL